MKKIYIFVLGIVVGVVVTFASLYTAMWIDSKYSDIVPIDTIDVVPDDTTYINSSLFMSEEEFIKEMMKGVQGDYTLEQVDSMRRSWAILDSIEGNIP